jgi:RNA polymerase sigma-70 factor (ECF subfamily)
MLLPKLSRYVGVVVQMDAPAFELALELAAALPRVARDTSLCVEQRGDADLAMERYSAGDNAAFARVYDALGPRLFAYLFRQTRDRTRAEDLLQQTMLHIHRARDRFIPGAQVTPWAFAIARRLLVDSTRRGRREVLGDGTDMDAGVAVSPRADDLVQASQIAVRIELVLASLPASQRTAFQLIKQEGLTVAEAAQVLGTTVAAVKLRAHRAYEALRAGLGEIGVGDESGAADPETKLRAEALKP